MAFDRAAWNRAWRRRNRAKTRAYDADRPARPRRKVKRERAAYFRVYRAANRKPRLVVRLRIVRPAARALQAFKAARLEAVEKALTADRAEALAAAFANPELAALLDSQAADARRYQIKFGPEFTDRRIVESRQVTT
jgi:hypothetical protein